VVRRLLFLGRTSLVSSPGTASSSLPVVNALEGAVAEVGVVILCYSRASSVIAIVVQCVVGGKLWARGGLRGVCVSGRRMMSGQGSWARTHQSGLVYVGVVKKRRTTQGAGSASLSTKHALGLDPFFEPRPCSFWTRVGAIISIWI
jgi:hypothetical protein